MYTVIRDKEKFDSLVKSSYLDKDKRVFLDTETTWSQGKTNNAKSAIGGLYGDVRLVQMYQSHWKKAIIVDCMFIDIVHVALCIQGLHQVWHNASYDLHTINLVTKLPYVPEKFDDTVYMARLCKSAKGSKFDFVSCLRYSGVYDPEVAGLNKKENQKSDWSKGLTDEQLRYAAFDVTYLEKMYNEMSGLKDWDDYTPYQLDIRNLKYALEYSRRGIPVCRDRVLETLKENVTRQEELYKLLPVNPNSPKQVKEWLGLAKTDKEALTEAALNGNTDAQNVIDARSVDKTIGFLKKYNRDVIKGFYNPCAAISGRSSCTGGDRYDHENLQQIPRALLRCLKAPDGYVFVYNDYAGVELRMAAAWIGDPVMYDLILRGVDLHSYTGSKLYNKPMEKLTKNERMVGKICNFLLIYGGSPKILQITMMAWGGIIAPYKDVQKIYDSWFNLYPYFKSWHDLTARVIQTYGFLDVTTALGRKVRTVTLNEAVNIPIQGSCAEVAKVALDNIHTRYPGTKVVSYIHDSITTICKEEDAEKEKEILNECMVDAWDSVVKYTELPELPMPGDAEANQYWEF